MIYPIKPCEIPRNFGAAAWWGPVCWSVASRERFPVESWFLPFFGGKSSWTIMESENHILRNVDCLVWFLIVFCCQSMFRVPTGWLALGKVCESQDPKFTWEGVECIRFSRLACHVKVLFLSQTWLMIWLDMFPLSDNVALLVALNIILFVFTLTLWWTNIAMENPHF